MYKEFYGYFIKYCSERQSISTFFLCRIIEISSKIVYNYTIIISLFESGMRNYYWRITPYGGIALWQSRILIF